MTMAPDEPTPGTTEETDRTGIAVLLKDVSPSFGPEQQSLADRLFWSFEQAMGRHYDDVETVYTTFCDDAQITDADEFYGNQQRHAGTMPGVAIEQVAGHTRAYTDVEGSDTYLLMVGDGVYCDRPEDALDAVDPDFTAHVTVAPGHDPSYASYVRDRLTDDWTYDEVVTDTADAIVVANLFADVVEETYGHRD